MSWNDERCERLKELWAEGLSASRIANAMGDTTRNAVIGKIHRMGLARHRPANREPVQRPRPPKRARQPRQMPAPAAKGRAFVFSGFASIDPAPPTPVQTIDEPTLVSWADLEDHHCRWIPHEPAGEHTRYCGKHKVHGQSYCAHHVKRAGAVALDKPLPKVRAAISGDVSMLQAAEEFAGA